MFEESTQKTEQNDI